MNLIDINRFIYIIPSILIGLTVHEYMHAKVAHLLGDDTAFQDGRITLNPIKHIDIIGFIFILFAGFGWAKPVMFNPEKLKNPRRDEMLIAIAGPFANFITAICFAIILKILILVFPNHENTEILFLGNIIITCIFINLGLFVFNMIPLPPLDGSHLLIKFLKIKSLTERLLYRYGTIVLFLIIIIESQFNMKILPISDLIRFLTISIFNLLQINMTL